MVKTPDAGTRGREGRATVRVGQSALVLGADSSEKRDLVEWLGATMIDYRESPIDDYVAEHTNGAGFDIVYDTVGGPSLDAAFQAVRRFGHVVSCLGWGDHALAPLSFRAAT